MGCLSAKQEAEAARLFERLAKLVMEDGHPRPQLIIMDGGHKVAIVVRVRAVEAANDAQSQLR